VDPDNCSPGSTCSSGQSNAGRRAIEHQVNPRIAAFPDEIIAPTLEHENNYGMRPF
jgi:hypothetical protein